MKKGGGIILEKKFNVKSFLWLGIIVNIVVIISQLFLYNYFITFILKWISFNIGMFIYLIFVLLRFHKKNVSIRLSKSILVCTLVLQIIFLLLDLSNSFIFNFDFSSLILYIGMLLYFTIWLLNIINLFYNKSFGFNNKIFVILNILYTIFILVYILIYKISIFNFMLLSNIGILSTLPYFYNYYNLKKGDL